jgi:hypothetical protein
MSICARRWGAAAVKQGARSPIPARGSAATPALQAGACAESRAVSAPVGRAGRAPALHSGHELVDELVVGVAAHALVLAAHIERALQQVLVVGACAPGAAGWVDQGLGTAECCQELPPAWASGCMSWSTRPAASLMASGSTCPMHNGAPLPNIDVQAIRLVSTTVQARLLAAGRTLRAASNKRAGQACRATGRRLRISARQRATSQWRRAATQHAGGAAGRGRARVDADRQAHVGGDAAARRVQRELRLGHAHRLRDECAGVTHTPPSTPGQADQQAASRTQLTLLPMGRTGA